MNGKMKAIADAIEERAEGDDIIGLEIPGMTVSECIDLT